MGRVITMPRRTVDTTPSDETSAYPEEVLQAGWNPDVRWLQPALQPEPGSSSAAAADSPSGTLSEDVGYPLLAESS